MSINQDIDNNDTINRLKYIVEKVNISNNLFIKENESTKRLYVAENLAENVFMQIDIENNKYKSHKILHIFTFKDKNTKKELKEIKKSKKEKKPKYLTIKEYMKISNLYYLENNRSDNKICE